jgi:hypothetical protein
VSPIVLLGLKVLLAGFFVALLSHLTGAIRPKLFSGLFAAAPTVASISLLVTALLKPATAAVGAEGMIAGALGMVACCGVVALLETRVKAMAATGVGWGAWTAVAAAAYWVLFR